MAAMKHSPLSRVESLIRRVVEEPFTWLGGGALDPFQLATHLARVYDAPPAGDELPNTFVVRVNAGDYQELEAAGLPLLQRQVGEYVRLMAGRRGHHLAEPPVVRFEPSARERPRSAHVTATTEAREARQDTEVFSAPSDDAIQAAIQAADAFLIVGGRQHVPLDRPVTYLGRRVENDIVLDDPSVSRRHAQIRWRQRYFVLYDVSGHGRTSVNGAVTQEHVLRPGDVIALSDVLLVYGEGREALAGGPPAVAEETDTTLLKPDE
jgi:hypothetical protein